MTPWRERNFDPLTPALQRILAHSTGVLLDATELAKTPNVIQHARSAVEKYLIESVRRALRHRSPTKSEARRKLEKISRLAQELDRELSTCRWAERLALEGEIRPSSRIARALLRSGSPPIHMTSPPSSEETEEREKAECALIISAPASIATAAERARAGILPVWPPPGRPMTRDIDDELISDTIGVFRAGGVEPRLKRNSSREVEGGTFVGALVALYDSLPVELRPDSPKVWPNRAKNVFARQGKKSL